MTTNLQDLFDQEKEKSLRSSYAIQYSADSREKMSQSLQGKKTWNRGVPATQERKDNISKAKKGKPNPKKCKPMMTPNGVFPSGQAVAKAAGVSYVTVYNWMKRWPNDYYYLENTLN